jgi:hypothetical protein
MLLESRSRTLCTGAPLFITDVTDIEELQIHLVIFDIDNITRCRALNGGAILIFTFNVVDVWQRGVFTCEFIHNHFVTFTNLLFKVGKCDEATGGLWLRVAAVAAYALKGFAIISTDIQIEVIAACRTVFNCRSHLLLPIDSQGFNTFKF